MNKIANTLVSIQMIPTTPNGESRIPYIDRAIEIIQQSGCSYRVGPLETSIEGELYQLQTLISTLIEEMVRLNCPSVLSQIKIFHKPTGISMGELVQKYED